MFAKLFNGGTATIKLTDEENVLESGVYYCPATEKPGNTFLYYPVGKGPLTAIALWFAIRRIKPTPFVFLMKSTPL